MSTGWWLDTTLAITVTLYYHSVENGSLGDIVPLVANESDGEGGTSIRPMYA